MWERPRWVGVREAGPKDRWADPPEPLLGTALREGIWVHLVVLCNFHDISDNFIL